jgi:hypothetical protein
MRKLSAVLASTLLMTLMIVAPAGAHDRSQTSVSHARIVQEQSFPDAPDATTRNVGWSRLVRTSDGYSATVFARGLNPGGVYTFWWVSPYEFNADGTPVIPGEVFVARGASSVVGADGTARVRMQATTGQLGIVGLPALGGLLWHEMKDPLTSIVRIEIAYHGQAADAGEDLGTWLSDFWTGTACPDDENTNNAGQPHCPVYLAATHIP